MYFFILNRSELRFTGYLYSQPSISERKKKMTDLLVMVEEEEEVKGRRMHDRMFNPGKLLDITCSHCGAVIKRSELFNRREELIEGFYDRETHAYVHYVCYDEREYARKVAIRNKEAGIYMDVQNAVDNKTLYAYTMGAPSRDYDTPVDLIMGYDVSPLRTAYKYCHYCEGQLDTSNNCGFSYPIKDKPRERLFMHIHCYNYISSKPCFNEKIEETKKI